MFSIYTVSAVLLSLSHFLDLAQAVVTQKEDRKTTKSIVTLANNPRKILISSVC